MMKLGVRFKSPREAHHQLSVGVSHETPVEQSIYSPIHIEVVHTHTPSNVSSGSSLEVMKSDPLLERICKLTDEEQVQLLGNLFCSLASRIYGVSVPSDFIKLSLCGMRHLQGASRLNVLYMLTKGFGMDHPDRRLPFSYK